jgi:hypothetical protein
MQADSTLTSANAGTGGSSGSGISPSTPNTFTALQTFNAGINLPNTTSATVGVIQKNGTPWIYDYGATAGESFWAGGAGNISGITAANVVGSVVIGGGDASYPVGPTLGSFTSSLTECTIVGCGCFPVNSIAGISYSSMVGNGSFTVYTGIGGGSVGYIQTLGTNLFASFVHGTVQDSVLVGDSHFPNATTGSYSNVTVIGDQIGTGMITGNLTSSNIIGGQSLPNTTSGNGNDSVGYATAFYTGACNYNSNFGFNSGGSATGTYSNVAAFGANSHKYDDGLGTGNQIWFDVLDRTNYAGQAAKSPLWIQCNATAASQTITMNSVLSITIDRGFQLTNQTSAAAGQVGTLTNAPVAGNPGFWAKMKIGGTNYTFPCWAA